MADEPQVPEGAISIPNVALEVFEKACYSRDHERASQLLIENIRRLKCGAQIIGYSRDQGVQAILFTRLTSAILTLFLDPAYNITPAGFDVFASEHATIDTVIRMSTFETSDHALAVLSENPEETDRSKLRIPRPEILVKFLLTYSLRSGFSLNFEDTFRRGPQAMFSLYMGMLAPTIVTAVTAHARRELLLGLHGLFDGKVAATEAMLPAMSDAYMYSSYGMRADKHDIKAMIHRVFAGFLRERKVKLPKRDQIAQRRRQTLGYLPSPGEHNDFKPCILVCTEWFSSLHAMFRCYAPIIRQLKQRFHVVGMGRPQDSDALGRLEFDEWHDVIDSGANFEAIIDTVNLIAPDVIYYPSLGMGLWWVAMASVRMAPVQIMTLGHPASSRSPVMDYVLCDEGAIGNPKLFTETIIEYPNGAGRYLMRPDAPDLAPLIEAKSGSLDMMFPSDTLHIAVPAMICKVTAPFMAALKQISDGCGRPVVFHFWANMIGVALMQAGRELMAWLPNSKIYERCPYADYMTGLSKCDLHLSPFPFGGTNSNIDSMLLGVPIITLWGDEPHQRFDGMMLQRAGMLDEVIASDVPGYIARAIHFLGDDHARLDLRKRLLAFDLTTEFYDPPPPELSTSFVDAVWRAFERGPTK